MKEANRLSIMRQIDKKMLSIKEASQELNLSSRQVRRLRKRYKAEGDQGLISKRRGHPNVRRYPGMLKKRVLELMKEPVREGWGPTFACEKLASMNQLHLSRETLRQWMIEEDSGKTSSRKRKKSIREELGEVVLAKCFKEMVPLMTGLKGEVSSIISVLFNTQNAKIILRLNLKRELSKH